MLFSYKMELGMLIFHGLQLSMQYNIMIMEKDTDLGIKSLGLALSSSL